MFLIRSAVRAIEALNNTIGNLVGIGLLVLIALVVWEVFLRYALNAPTTWGNELITYLFAGYILLGGGYTLLHSDHVAMDVIYSQLSPRKKAILDVLTAGFVLIYCIVLLQQTWIMTSDAWETGQRAGTDWGPLLYPVYAAMPIGAMLVLLQAIAKLFRDLYLAFTGDPLLPDPTADEQGGAVF